MKTMSILDPCRVVSRHRSHFTTPPSELPAGNVDVSGNGRWRIWEYAGTKIDAPILGNGDLLAAFAGPPQWPQFWITTNDFWQMESSSNWEFFHDNAVAKHSPVVSLGSPRPIGRMVFDIPGLADATYHVEQDFATATTKASYTLADGTRLSIDSFVAATENTLIVEFESNRFMNISVDFHFPDEGGKGCEAGIDFEGNGNTKESLQDTFAGLVGGKPLQVKTIRKGLVSGYRAFTDHVDVPTKSAFAGRFVDEREHVVTLYPGRKKCFVIAVRSWAKVSRPYEYARSRAAWITEYDVAELRRQHLAWWRDYWSTSGIEVDSPLLEETYYLSQYMLGSLSRDPAYPPNILGISTYDRMAWNGNYKINYNHQSPYLGLMAAGHFEQSDPHDAPYFDMMDIAREMSARLTHHEGVYLPLGLGPVGMVSEALLLYMKSPAVHGALNMIIRYRLTKDTAYIKKAYPYLKCVADFWAKDLVYADGHYHIVGDGMHERVTSHVLENGMPENPTNTLGYLYTFFDAMADIAADLDIDTDQIHSWKHFRDHLIPYATGSIRDLDNDPKLWAGDDFNLSALLPEDQLDKTIFFNEGKGGKWSTHFPGNIMQIYPGGAIGLTSPPELLETARNTIHIHALLEDATAAYRMEHNIENRGTEPHFYKHGAWNATNLSCLFFPAAVRVGYDPDIIWSELTSRLKHRRLPNGFIRENPHGIENLSTVPNTLQEMMLLSHEGILRLFKVWPRENHPNAAFTKLWAYGAFQASASLKDGVVGDILIHSNKGSTCTLENPWPGQEVVLHRITSDRIETCSGDFITFDTHIGEDIIIAQK